MSVNKTKNIISKFITISQMTLVGTPNVIENADSSYEDYANNFDLSLLSMDTEFNSLVNGNYLSVHYNFFFLFNIQNSYG